MIENDDAITRGLGAGGSEVCVGYCAKTNNEAGILRAFAAHASHVLSATAEEAQLAIACGFPPDRIAFQRPILTESELGRVLDAGVRHVHVHHPQEIDLLESVAAARRVAISVSVRARVTGIGVWRSPAALLGTRLGQLASVSSLCSAARLAMAPAVRSELLCRYTAPEHEAVSRNAERPLRDHRPARAGARLAP